MDEQDSLWVMPSHDVNLNLTENLPQTMQRQCEALEKASGGKVHGRFGKVRTFADTADYVARKTAMGQIQGTHASSQAKDVSELYATHRYAFEIYSNGYSYRIFEMKMPPIYPVSMIFDEGLLSDKDLPIAFATLTNGEWLEAESEDEVIGYLSAAIASEKMQLILYRLLHSDDQPDGDSDYGLTVP